MIHIHITLDLLKILQHIIVVLIPSNILFSHGLLLNGTNWICNVTKLLNLLKSIQPLSKPIYNIYNLAGMSLLTRLRLGLSDLNEHRLNHNFEGCINPFCNCTLEVELTSPFYLHRHYHNNIHKTLSDHL